MCGCPQNDLKLPADEIGAEIKKALDEDADREIIVSVQSAMNEEAIIAWKYDNK